MPNNKIKIKEGKSSLSEFVRRQLPTDEEAEKFEEYVEAEAKEEHIKDSLAEIYQDDDGKMVDVKKLEVKKHRGFVFRFLTMIFCTFIIAGGVYLGYYYFYLAAGKGQPPVELAIQAPAEVIAGQEFFYTVNYKNNDYVEIKNLELRLTLPESFIFLESQPEANQKNNLWQIEKLGAHRSDTIKIKGKIIAEDLTSHQLAAELVYQPANFSSEFKKSTSFTTMVNGLGINFNIISSSSVLVGQENELTIKYQAQEENYLNNFRLTLEPLENLEIIKQTSSATTSGQQVLPANVWQINKIGLSAEELKIKFKISQKKTNQQELALKFESPIEQDNQPRYFLFYKKIISFEVVKSNLNLTLIINGSQADQGIDFGQVLNCSIVFANKEENPLKDLVIMAVLESDFLDWESLADKNYGKVSASTISWSKADIPLIAELALDQEGVIDFSIKVKPAEEIDLAKNYQVKSYIQHSVEAQSSGQDNRSNTIINKINSDLKLEEKVRYFNQDNLAVGFGPLPPKVGETTSFKVYWTIKNNLHELNNLTVWVNLPAEVKWDDKNRVSAGSLDYDSANHQVKWQIGRLPITVYQTQAEFNLSLTPTEADRNKIMVILPGSRVSAFDSQTNAEISKTLPAKTTRLEDDEIANIDGLVQ